MPEIGSLEPADLRELWDHEAHDFTPWLASHIDRLAAKLDLSFEQVETEVTLPGGRDSRHLRPAGRNRGHCGDREPAGGFRSLALSPVAGIRRQRGSQHPGVGWLAASPTTTGASWSG